MKSNRRALRELPIMAPLERGLNSEPAPSALGIEVEGRNKKVGLGG